jgi:hypothetical protein
MDIQTKKLIASIKLVPRFSRQHGPDHYIYNGHKYNIFKTSEYETNLNFIDKRLNHPGSKGKDIITYTRDCTHNNRRSTNGPYFHKLFSELKILNKLLKTCPDFDEQIEKNKYAYFFNFEII